MKAGIETGAAPPQSGGNLRSVRARVNCRTRERAARFALLTTPAPAGIRTAHIYGFTFALGAALAGAAGMLLGSIYVAQATIGGLVSLKAFVVVILGGMGSFAGAIVGGLILGVAEALWGGYVATGYVDAIGFALVIIMLLARPYGLFGKHNERA